MTARQAADRPATAEEVIASIDAILGSCSLQATAHSTGGTTASRFIQRRRLVLGALGSTAILSTAALVRFAWPLPSQTTLSRIARQRFEAACPDFATNLDLFAPGTEELLLTPTKLGDGADRDYSCTDEELSLHVFEQNNQVWLNYESMRGSRICLFMRAKVLRYQTGFANCKVALLDHQGRECNFQWVHDGHAKRLLLEVVTQGRLNPVWQQELNDDEAPFAGDIALHLNGTSLEVYLNNQLLTVQACEESPARFPAIAAIGCDVSICALARLVVT